MHETLDIQKVISTSTSSVSLDDLTKKGFKQVKVLNQVTITKLIAEAVDRVLTERSKEISKEEREKVIKEARSQFETLAKKRMEKERSRIDDLERVNSSLETEMDTLRKRLAASVEMQASRDQAVARLEGLEAELSRVKSQVPELEANLARYKAESEQVRTELTSRGTELAARSVELGKLAGSEARALGIQKEAEALRARVADLETESRKREDEVSSLRVALGEQEKHAALLEGQITAKNEELERAKSGAGSESTIEKLLQVLNERMGKSAQPSEVSQIMLSLDGLSRRMANLSGGGIGGIGGTADAELTKDFALDALFDQEKGGGIQSNISKVKVKENKATGVKGALAKLKKMQQGGADAE